MREMVKRRGTLLVLLMLAAILLTRGIGLEHGIAYHPDEHVFFESAASLKEHWLHPDVPFEESKEYPEGAYVFQAPFHVVGSWFGVDSPAICGRMAAVFYFAAGCVIGCLIMYRFWGRKWETVLVYALLMTFGMLHIEQSRYGTGEAISFFLLMILVYACAACADSGGKKPVWGWMVTAGLSAGALGAVKYPQLYFLLCPLGVLLHSRAARRERLLPGLAALLLSAAAGLLLFSPKAAADPMYFVRVCQRELGAYVFDGDISEMGGKLNHIVSLVLYHTLYADIPLALPIAAAVILRKLFSMRRETLKSGTECFFGVTLPVLTAVFALYNLMVKSMFFRTLYPYFCLMALYTAAGCGAWLQRKGWRRMAVLALCAVLAGRGCVMTATFADHGAQERVTARMEEILQSGDGASVVRLRPGTAMQFPADLLSSPAETLHMDYIPVGQVEELEPGVLVVTEALNFGRAGEYLLPVGVDRLNTRIANWKQFKEINEPYLVMKAYPDWFYWYSGYWIKGSTGAEYEYPAFWLYYRPAE